MHYAMYHENAVGHNVHKAQRSVVNLCVCSCSVKETLAFVCVCD